ncbi:MAG TPA: hypothetical protein VN258_06620, partial [Mobilitalea sp.]|nr:hypothetical protein [Mobilitalea sp.]
MVIIMRINDIGLNKRYGKGFSINRSLWTRDYLLIHFRTPATVILDGKEVQARTGSIIIFHVGTPQYYRASQDTYTDDYIHFFVDDDYSYITNLGIPFNTVIELPNTRIFSRLFMDLQNEFLSGHKNKESSIDCLLKLLFN